MNTSDPEDVQRIGTDADAFESFYREHVDAVQRFVARRVADPYLAADLTADIFLAAMDAAARYDPGRGAPIAWLYGIARNVVAAELRRSARELKAVSRVSGRRLLDPESVLRAEERIDAERRLREVYEAMAVLSEDDRALFELVAVDGLSIADAGRVLGVKPGTARVRLHRSRRLIKNHLQPEGPTAQAARTQEATT